MRLLLVVGISLGCLSNTKASDDIRDFVQYQVARQRSYADALLHHKLTKQNVTVWVGQPDNDATFEAWKLRKNSSFHVFVDTCGDLPKGITVGGDANGQFVRLSHDPLLPNPTPIRSSCPNGRCPIR